MTAAFSNRTFCIVFVLINILVLSALSAAEVFDAADVFRVKTISSFDQSPDGEWIAYTVRVERDAADEAGSAYSELYVVSRDGKTVRSLLTGKVTVSAPVWSADGKNIAFRMKKGKDDLVQIWIIPASGGEARQVSDSPTKVLSHRWHPDGKRLAYTAKTPATAHEKALKEKGYGFVYFEENLKHQNIFMVSAGGEKNAAEQITNDLTVWNFEFNRAGTQIAVSASEKNLVDHQYMFNRIYIIDLETGKHRQLTKNPGKLGNYAFSPDDKNLAYCAASERKDHAPSQVLVIPVAGGEARNLTKAEFKGHVNWVAWKDNQTVFYRAGEGIWPTLSTVNINGGERTVLMNSKQHGVSFGKPKYTSDFKRFAMTGTGPSVPGDLYVWGGKEAPRRIITLNPWLEEKALGKQEVIKYKARDGQDIEGLLVKPVGFAPGTKYPLIVYVHGGPESHYSNQWITRYSTPGQVMAGKGYLILYPNYRASTGYGVKYSLAGYGDPAGVEFDDVADGIDHLVNSGLADRDRVGLAGGSYGGFASAWFATYYTRYVKAVCMFVGISNLISKRGTTDIPYEDMDVHTGAMLEDTWDLNLKRSPIYWAHQSKTATLIYGGQADTRVHPSQSKELYRRMKMNNHPAVRLVQYPGERHGNRKQPGRIDVLHRQMQWFDWYVRDLKPLDGEMPPLDISDSYGLDLDQETEKK